MKRLTSLEDSVSAVVTICNAVEKYWIEPSLSWPMYEFKRRSYQRWAAEEICTRIMNNPFDDIGDTIDTYIIEMELCRCKSESSDSKEIDSTFIFTIAIETAEDIMRLIT